MLPSRTLEVLVTDADDVPLADVQVLAYRGIEMPPPDGVAESSGSRFDLVTGADGVATNTALHPGQYLVQAAGGHAVVDLTDDDASIVIVAVEPQVVTGRLVDGVGDPVSGGLVSLVAPDPDSGDRVVISTVTTDDGATFTLDLLAVDDPSAAEVVAVAPEIGVRAVAITRGTDDIDLGDIGPLGTRLRLQIPWNDDPATLVTLYPADLGDDLAVLNIADDLDDPTELTYEALTPGEYVVRVGSEGRRFSAEVDVSDTAEQVTVLPVPAGMVELDGVVTDGTEADDPVADALVLAWRADLPASTWTTNSDADGAFTFGLVEPGVWQVAAVDDEEGVLWIRAYEAGVGPVPGPLAGVLALLGLSGPNPNHEPGQPPLVHVPFSNHAGARLFYGPEDRGCTSSGATLSAVGRVTSDVFPGVWDGKSTAVYIRPLGSPGFVGSVPATDPDGWFRTMFLPDGNYELIVRAEGHEPTAPITFTIPQDTPAGLRCGASLGNIQRGALIMDDENPPPPPLPGWGELYDIWAKSFSDDRPSRDAMQRIIDFKPPEEDGGGGDDPKPKPPPPRKPCPGERVPARVLTPPTPPSERPTADDGPRGESDEYLAAAKRAASKALDQHDHWGETLVDIRKQGANALVLMGARFVIILNSVISIFSGVGSMVKGAKKLQEATRGIQLIEQAEEASKVRASLQKIKDLMDLVAPIQALPQVILTETVNTLFNGEGDEAQLQADITAAMLDTMLQIAYQLPKLLPDSSTLKAFGGGLPIISEALTIFENYNGAINDYAESARLLKSFEKIIEDLERFFEHFSTEAQTYWQAYLDARTNEKADDPNYKKRPLPPLPPRPGPKKRDCGDPRPSSDPNEITGPAGFGDDRWVRPGDLMPYLVQFENLGPGSTFIPPGVPMAEAPAAVVDVRLPLDPSFDLASFAFGSFGYGTGDGEVTFGVPPGSQQFATTFLEDEPRELLRFDQPGTEMVTLEVRASAWIDHGAREARWLIELVDPATGEPHPDPTAGFLPPEPEEEELRGSGQGYGMFTVATFPTLPTGTIVEAQAAIVFDDNEVIETNRWTNRLDRTPPVGSMQPLAAETPLGAMISWTGSDEGAGVERYDVYRQIGDGPLLLWQPEVEETSVAMEGTVGTTYGFAVVAVDGVGLSQAVPTEAQVVTTATEVELGDPPGPPTVISVVPGDRSVTVTWAPPDDEGGSPITSYLVTALPGGQTCSTTGAVSCTVDGLTNWYPYAFAVRAVNLAGGGAFSAWSTTVHPGLPHGFGDVPVGAFYEVAVGWLKEFGITTGFGGSTTVFAPDVVVTRGQMAAFLHRMMDEPVGPPHGFGDVPDGSFYAQAVGWLREAGITTGFGGSNSVFAPDEPVTRGQMAAFLHRMSGEPPPSLPHGFGDVPVGAFYEVAVGWLKEFGITTGFGGSTTVFAPDVVVTRGQMAAFLHRLASNPTAWAPGVTQPSTLVLP
jgi:hypothetical protein